MPRIGSIGERLDLRIKQGATFGPFNAVMRNPDNTPVDLTGCQIRGKIRHKGLSEPVLAAIEVVSAYDSTGTYSFGLSDSVTASLPCGELETASDSIHTWDLELEDASGRVTALYYGDASVFREVTR